MERRRDTIAADGQFHSYEEWARLGPLPPFRSAVFIDARGRRCLTHRDFVRAREDGAFPVSVSLQVRTTVDIARTLPPERRLTVILISFAFFFATVAWSGQKLVRAMRNS